MMTNRTNMVILAAIWETPRAQTMPDAVATRAERDSRRSRDGDRAMLAGEGPCHHRKPKVHESPYRRYPVVPLETTGYARQVPIFPPPNPQTQPEMNR